MQQGNKMGRRAACAGLLGVGGGLMIGGVAAAQQIERRQLRVRAAQPQTPLTFNNADFYDAEGKFRENAAKRAYLALMRRAGYPISKNLTDNMWVAEFGLGRFTEVGLAGMFWINSKEYNYTSLEMFLLPNQMVPEHWHTAVPEEDVAAKMESWHVRWGETYTYGEGDPTPKIGVKIHEAEAKYVTVMNETPLKVGEVTGIKRPLEKHWQQAGPMGCIMTESSTYHTGAAVKFTNPDIVF